MPLSEIPPNFLSVFIMQGTGFFSNYFCVYIEVIMWHLFLFC
jgi:hypothetical protein